jgi:hypothetical protein
MNCLYGVETIPLPPTIPQVFDKNRVSAEGCGRTVQCDTELRAGRQGGCVTIQHESLPWVTQIYDKRRLAAHEGASHKMPL